MEVIKKSELEFDISYADGTEKHVKEGLLLEFIGNKIQCHIGTNRKECIFASVEALEELIVVAGFIGQYKDYRGIERTKVCGVDLTELELALSELKEYQETGLTPEQIRDMK